MRTSPSRAPEAKRCADSAHPSTDRMLWLWPCKVNSLNLSSPSASETHLKDGGGSGEVGGEVPEEDLAVGGGGEEAVGRGGQPADVEHRVRVRLPPAHHRLWKEFIRLLRWLC